MSMPSARWRKTRSGPPIRGNIPSSGTRSSARKLDRSFVSSAAPRAEAMTGWRGALAGAMRIILAALLFLAIADMLAGVLLRYVVTAVTDYFDWPSVSFFWVEEAGEFALAWLTLLGAAVAILERTHFALSVLTHRFPPRLQRAIERVNYLLIAGFGGFAAFYGYKLCRLNF